MSRPKTVHGLRFTIHDSRLTTYDSRYFAMRVTMSDVARAAQVNKATVSRVLRGDARISPATVEKVWAAIKELGYRPDA
ncbi:MAG TPA: LacI family DNA-binding transcriptional regulator, partial [Synergistales bacterium]|nr:LacI family DNA-binding transcriptional regulator [Synergistales bacterium]